MRLVVVRRLLFFQLNHLIIRSSTSKLGFLNDPFIGYFLKRMPIAKQPVIHWGTYARFKSIIHYMSIFVESHSQKSQIVCLGAGLDTTCFLYRSMYNNEI